MPWLDQAAFKLTTPGGKVIVTDPFLVNNPKTPAEYKNLDTPVRRAGPRISPGHDADRPLRAGL